MEQYPSEEESSAPERRENLRINSIVIPADDEEPLRQADLSVGGLEDRQQLVGGLIQGVDLPDPPARLYFNEDGKLMKLPPNKRATLLLWLHNPRFRYRDFIVGDAFMVGPVGRRSADTSVPDQYVRTLFEGTRFRVDLQPRGTSEWNEHPERFDNWETAYEHAMGWSGALPRHLLAVRVLPEA